MSEDFLTVDSAHECQGCGYSWVGTSSEFCVECKVDDLERQLAEARNYLIQASEADWTEELNDYVRQLKEKGE